jgi:hypothetical protein
MALAIISRVSAKSKPCVAAPGKSKRLRNHHFAGRTPAPFERPPQWLPEAISMAIRRHHLHVHF